MERRIIMILLRIIVISISIFIYSCGSPKIIEKKSINSPSSLLADTARLKQEARYFYINGINYQVQYKDAEAIIEFLEALSFDKAPSIYYSIAKSYFNLYKRDRALENLNFALELDPNHIPSLDLISDIYYFKDIKLAVIYNEKALELERTRERLYKHAILNESINLDKSITLYNELLRSDEKNIMVLQKLANLYLENEREDEALEILNKLNTADPGNIENFDQIIKILLNQKKYDETFNFVKSHRLNVSELEYERIIYDVGLILNNFKEKDPSINMNVYLDYIFAEFKFNHELMMLGSWLSSKHKIESLNKFIDNALKTSDTLSKTISLSLNLFSLVKDTINSINLINKYTKEIENDLDLLIYVSFFYSLIDKDEISLDYLKKGLILDSNNADIYSQMGFVYDKLGVLEKSDSAYTMALILDPNHPNANNNFAYSLAIRDIRLEDALKMSQIVIDANIESSAYYDTYAWINYKLGKLNIALNYLQKAVELSDTSAEVYEHLGIVQFDLKLLEDAKSSFEKALELDPNRTISREKLEKLSNK